MHKINWPAAVFDGQKKIVDVRESADSVNRVSLGSSLAFVGVRLVEAVRIGG